MEVVEILIIMLVMVLVSYILHVYLKKVSMPLIQILLGMLLIFMPVEISIEIETELFLLIFIAPMLFLDSRKYKMSELKSLRNPISFLAVGLVFLNVAVCGFFIYALIDEVPLAAAFALAAVLSPTDAVAVKAITEKIPLPEKIRSIIEGEYLFNDATGLVAYNFAIIAALSGIFVIQNVVASFLYVALGGIFAGLLGAFLVHYIVKFLRRVGIEELNTYTLLQIITPFVIFIVTEYAGASGILGVVVCGIANARLAPRLMSSDEAQIRFNSGGAWGILTFTLNGIIFVMLGMLVSEIFLHSFVSEMLNVYEGFIYICAIVVIFGAVRFLYSYFLINVEGAGRLKNSLMLSFAGVRGALTLAVCLSIPVYMTSGEDFPGREMILFVSSGVILLSLIIANIFLPLIAPKSETDNYEAVNDSLVKVVDSAIIEISKRSTHENHETAGLLLTYFEYLYHEADHTTGGEVDFGIKESSKKSLLPVLSLECGYNSLDDLLKTKILDKFHLEFIAIEIQKNQILQLVERNEMDIQTAYRLRYLLSLEEAALFEDDLKTL